MEAAVITSLQSGAVETLKELKKMKLKLGYAPPAAKKPPAIFCNASKFSITSKLLFPATK